MIRKIIAYTLFVGGFVLIKVLAFDGHLPESWPQPIPYWIKLGIPVALMACGLLVLGKRKGKKTEQGHSGYPS